jgi:hypothetical protein
LVSGRPAQELPGLRCRIAGQAGQRNPSPDRPAQPAWTYGTDVGELGGHFAAMEQPEALAEEVSALFRPLRG